MSPYAVMGRRYTLAVRFRDRTPVADATLRQMRAPTTLSNGRYTVMLTPAGSGQSPGEAMP